MGKTFESPISPSNVWTWWLAARLYSGGVGPGGYKWMAERYRVPNDGVVNVSL